MPWASIRSVGATVQGAAASAITMPAPAGIVDGDILIAIVNSTSNADSPSLTGFTSKSSRSTTNRAGTQNLLWKRASSESGDYTTGTPSGTIWGHVICVKDAIASGDPFDAVALNDTTNSVTTLTCSAIVPATNRDVLIAGYYQLTASLVHSAYTGGNLVWSQKHRSETSSSTNSVGYAFQATAGSVTASATTSATGFSFLYSMSVLSSTAADSAAAIPDQGVIQRAPRTPATRRGLQSLLDSRDWWG